MDLRACPFCGGVGELIEAPETVNLGAVVVECKTCGASGPCVFGCKEDPNPVAILAWNRRPINIGKNSATAVVMDAPVPEGISVGVVVMNLRMPEDLARAVGEFRHGRKYPSRHSAVLALIAAGLRQEELA